MVICGATPSHTSLYPTKEQINIVTLLLTLVRTEFMSILFTSASEDTFSQTALWSEHTSAIITTDSNSSVPCRMHRLE